MIEKIEKRIKVLEELKKNSEIEKGLNLLLETIKNKKTIFICGNGGSSTQASHFAAELINKFYKYTKPTAAIALNDVANITSIANDKSYDNIFSRQIEALGKEGDMFIGLTTSGKSNNVLYGSFKAMQLKLKSILLIGGETPKEKLSDIIINVASFDTPIIQECHLFILHHFAEEIEKYMIFSDTFNKSYNVSSTGIQEKRRKND